MECTRTPIMSAKKAVIIHGPACIKVMCCFEALCCWVHCDECSLRLLVTETAKMGIDTLGHEKGHVDRIVLLSHWCGCAMRVAVGVLRFLTCPYKPLGVYPFTFSVVKMQRILLILPCSILPVIQASTVEMFLCASRSACNIEVSAA